MTSGYICIGIISSGLDKVSLRETQERLRWNDRRRERILHDFFCVVCNWTNVSSDRPINNERNKSCFVSDRQRWSGQLFITRAPLCRIISVALSVHLSCSIGSRQGLSLLPLLFTLNKKRLVFSLTVAFFYRNIIISGTIITLFSSLV